MSRIFLVRHGEVEGNSGNRPTFSGWHDVVLTARGQAQAQATAQRLAGEHIGAVFSSDLQRARDTAEKIAARHGLVVQTDTALREVNYGAWSGLGEAEIEAGWSDLWRRRLSDAVNVAAPEGESLRDLQKRLLPAWQRIVETNRESERDFVVVGHNGSIRVLVCYLLGVPLENYRRVRSENCGITGIEISPDAKPPVVLFVNETSHLKSV